MRQCIIPSTEFIAGWYIDESVCDDLVSYFEESPDKTAGETGRGVDPEFKRSTDLTVIPRTKDPRVQTYLAELGKVCDNYTEKFEWSSKSHNMWGLNTTFNIQKYNPGEGFFQWHMERSSPKNLNSLRHLVFMTYLNTVTDGGETEWYHQRLKLQPVKGLTVIWPCDWTHVHRGVTSPTQVKYITTGWYTYTLEGFDYTEFNGG